MARGFYNGIRFAHEDRRYVVCAWDDTDEMWICKNTFLVIIGFLLMSNWKKFFSKKYKIILTALLRCDIMLM